MDENKTVSTEMHDDWDDMDFSDVADNTADEEWDEAPAEERTGEPDAPTETEADHSEKSEDEEKPEDTETKAEEKAEADHSFKLKYMDEEKVVSREEIIPLAQKGMDYDRIRGKYEEEKQRADANAEAAEFIASLAKEAGMSSSDFIQQALAGNLAKRENISVEEAKRRLDLDRREKALAAKEKAAEARATETKAQDARREKVRAEIAEFAKAYPDVDVRNIPTEVYQQAAKLGLGLTAAYAMHEAQQAKAALEAEKQNTKNKERSVGSSSTSGKRTPADEFDAAWYDGT